MKSTASFDRTAHPRLTIVCQVKSRFLHMPTFKAITLDARLAGMPIIPDWFQTSNMTCLDQWILAGTLCLFGFGTIFASLFVGIIDLQRESLRSGYAAGRDLTRPALRAAI